MNKIKLDTTTVIFAAIAVFSCASILRVIFSNKKENNVKLPSPVYLYTITAPNLGMWQTTNYVYNWGTYVKFTIDEQEIYIRTPFVITKEIYAPTNFIADEE